MNIDELLKAPLVRFPVEAGDQAGFGGVVQELRALNEAVLRNWTGAVKEKNNGCSIVKDIQPSDPYLLLKCFSVQQCCGPRTSRPASLLCRCCSPCPPSLVLRSCCTAAGSSQAPQGSVHRRRRPSPCRLLESHQLQLSCIFMTLRKPWRKSNTVFPRYDVVHLSWSCCIADFVLVQMCMILSFSFSDTFCFVY